MKDVLASILSFLQTSGLLCGDIPPRDFYSDDILCIEDPVDIVRIGIRISHPGRHHQFQNILAGVSIGAHPRECYPTVPDMLLGILRRDTGAWEWAGDHPGHVVNLHATSSVPKYTDGWPVWLTFAQCPGAREDLIKSKTKEFDVYEDLLKKRRTDFWNSTYQEFIQRTWHPSRLPWCLDADEHRELFS